MRLNQSVLQWIGIAMTLSNDLGESMIFQEQKWEEGKSSYPEFKWVCIRKQMSNFKSDNRI